MKFWKTICLLITLGTGAATHSETRALIATGLGGNENYELEFQRHANRLSRHLEEVSEDVTLLIGATADREAVQIAVESLIDRTSTDDTLLFVYIGHGSYNGEQFKFNVSGPDFSATELAGWLEGANARHQLIVVTGASSGAVQEVLAAAGRTVISGTRSGEQRNATVFGGYFTAALEDQAADLDKDQRITALEAFQYAESGIDAYYRRNNEMTTENPISSGPQPVMVLSHLAAQPELDPAQSHLLTQRESLELDIAGLRANKDDYTPEDYYAELQRLLLDLAMVEAQLASSSSEEGSL